MNEQDTLREVVALFNTYPGVSVVSAGSAFRTFSIELTCGRMSILARIAAWVMEGANQRIEIRCSQQQDTKSGGRFMATDIHFRVEVARFPRKNERHTPLQILGIFLVWDLWR